MGAKLVNAVSAVNVRQLDKEASALMTRLDSFMCAATTQDRDSTNQFINGDLRKEEGNLIIRAAEFVESCSNYIIENAALSIKKSEIEEIKISLKEMNPLIAVELLFAANYTRDISNLMGMEFMDNLRRLDTYVASALLYEIRLTGNAEMLTDKRLFQKSAAEFFNQLGPEGASEWFNSIGRTGNISALTSETALSIDVLNAVKENANIASELSYAIGDTGRTESLTSREFLGILKGLDSNVAAEYLSAIWCTKRVDELTSSEIIGRISSGEADVWKDTVRLFKNEDPNAIRVIISKADSSQHDRGVKLIVQSLISSGFDVIYTGSTQSQEEIISTAIKERAHAIGFSIAGDASQKMVTDAMAMAKMRGINDISFFAGGMINPTLANILEQRGARLFMQGSTSEDLVNFLKVPRNGAVQHEPIGIYSSKQIYRSASGFSVGNATGTEIIANNKATASGIPSTFLMNILFRLNVAPMVPFWLSNPALYPTQGISQQQQSDYQKTMEVASQMISANIQAEAAATKVGASIVMAPSPNTGSYVILPANAGYTATLANQQLAGVQTAIYGSSSPSIAAYSAATIAISPGMPPSSTSASQLITAIPTSNAFAASGIANVTSLRLQGNSPRVNFEYPVPSASKDVAATVQALHQSIRMMTVVQQTSTLEAIEGPGSHIKPVNMSSIRPENSNIPTAQIRLQNGSEMQPIPPNVIGGTILVGIQGVKIQNYAAGRVSAAEMPTNIIQPRISIPKAQKPGTFIYTKTEGESGPMEMDAKRLKALANVLKDNTTMLSLANSGSAGESSPSLFGYGSEPSKNQRQTTSLSFCNIKSKQEYYADTPQSGRYYGEFQHTAIAEIVHEGKNALGLSQKILNALLNAVNYCIKLIVQIRIGLFGL